MQISMPKKLAAVDFNEHDFIWQNTFNSLIKSACLSFMQM